MGMRQKKDAWQCPKLEPDATMSSVDTNRKLNKEINRMPWQENCKQWELEKEVLRGIALGGGSEGRCYQAGPTRMKILGHTCMPKNQEQYSQDQYGRGVKKGLNRGRS